MHKAAILPGISELILGLAGTERMIQGIASDFFDPLTSEHFRLAIASKCNTAVSACHSLDPAQQNGERFSRNLPTPGKTGDARSPILGRNDRPCLWSKAGAFCLRFRAPNSASWKIAAISRIMKSRMS